MLKKPYTASKKYLEAWVYWILPFRLTVVTFVVHGLEEYNRVLFEEPTNTILSTLYLQFLTSC